MSSVDTILHLPVSRSFASFVISLISFRPGLSTLSKMYICISNVRSICLLCFSPPPSSRKSAYEFRFVPRRKTQDLSIRARTFANPNRITYLLASMAHTPRLLEARESVRLLYACGFYSRVVRPNLTHVVGVLSLKVTSSVYRIAGVYIQSPVNTRFNSKFHRSCPE